MPSRETAQSCARYFASLTEARLFNGAALVARAGDVVFEGAAGDADHERRIPSRTDTTYRIGSVTKPITATAIFSLSETGAISIAAPISRYLPQCPASWSAITVAHLLSHASGIPSYTRLAGYPAFMRTAASPSETLKRVEHLPLAFPPGTRSAYSNSGYLLLGMIIEHVTAVPYATWLQRGIFGPAGMGSSGCGEPVAGLRMAVGYTCDGEKIAPACEPHSSIAFSAGSCYSRVEDLWRFAAALFGGSLLRPDSVACMTMPVHAAYASGWFVGQQQGHRMIWHNGGIGGFSSHLAYFPAEQVTVVVLSNHATGDADAVARGLASITLGEPWALPRRREPIAVAPELIEQYVGTYRFPGGQTVSVTLSQGRLCLQSEGQEAFPGLATSRNEFFLPALDAEFSFDVGERGEVRLTLRQAADTFVADKTEPSDDYLP
ncbi:MAG TPA: serine hydrolase [Burkholderiales bacterium]|nr:serine hydrolase [Burkholderiales bacterium]